MLGTSLDLVCENVHGFGSKKVCLMAISCNNRILCVALRIAIGSLLFVWTLLLKLLSQTKNEKHQNASCQDKSLNLPSFSGWEYEVYVNYPRNNDAVKNKRASSWWQCTRTSELTSTMATLAFWCFLYDVCLFLVPSSHEYRISEVHEIQKYASLTIARATCDF
jgi:hypothetical protein